MIQTEILKRIDNLVMQQNKFFKACFSLGYSTATAKRIMKTSTKTRFSHIDLVYLLKYRPDLISQELKDEIFKPVEHMKQVVSILQEFKKVENEQ